jgi:putative acetyltransferase
MAPMHVRPFRADDAKALAGIFYAAVHRLTLADYSDEQRRAWAPAPPDPASFVARASDGRLFLVAVDGRDAPVAYGDIEANGHIDHLYRHPDVAGAASALYDRLEREAVDRGVGLLTVEASETARRFFLRRGFAEVARREFLLRGVPIHNWSMEKTLRRASF